MSGAIRESVCRPPLSRPAWGAASAEIPTDQPVLPRDSPSSGNTRIHEG